MVVESKKKFGILKRFSGKKSKSKYGQKYATTSKTCVHATQNKPPLLITTHSGLLIMILMYPELNGDIPLIKALQARCPHAI